MLAGSLDRNLVCFDLHVRLDAANVGIRGSCPGEDNGFPPW